MIELSVAIYLICLGMIIPGVTRVTTFNIGTYLDISMIHLDGANCEVVA